MHRCRINYSCPKQPALIQIARLYYNNRQQNMRHASGKKFVFVQKEQSYDLTPQKKQPAQKRLSEAPRDRHVQQQPSVLPKTRTNQQKGGIAPVPPSIPRQRKPVDVLKYANDIVERARKADNEGTPKEQLRDGSPSQLQRQTQTRRAQQPPVQQPASKGSTKQLHSEPVPPPPVPSKNSIKQQPQPPSAPTTQPRKNDNSKALQQYELREKELLSKIDFLEEQVHSSTKQFQQLQSKYNTLVKDHKNCTKEIKRLNDLLRQKELALTKLLQADDIPYDRKRECILQNQIRNLRDYNRELVLRLKAYKGSELAEMAVQFNKVSILNDYVKEQTQDSQSGRLQLESLAYKLLKDLDQYSTARAKNKLSFSDQQKQLVMLQKNINTFCMECLAQGLRVPTEQADSASTNVTAAVTRECQSSKLLSQFDIAIRNTEFNLKVCSELDAVMEDQQELATYLQRANVNKLIEECFNVKGKKPPDIARAAEQKIFVYVNRHARMVFVLLSALTTTLARYDVLSSYLTETVGRFQSELKKLARPLEDLYALYEHGNESSDSAYQQKLTRFVRNNIDYLRLQVPAVQQLLLTAGIDFSKLRNLI